MTFIKTFQKSFAVAATILSVTGMTFSPTLVAAQEAAQQAGVAFRKAEPVTPVKIDVTTGIQFAHEHSDLLPDLKARFGRLKNGMTYVIYRNATPPGTASIRLRVNAGSLMENDAQRGLAHFLEHMAFNGSKNVPEGEMVKILERHGLKFGPDTNAYTSFDETVYMLELPTTGDEIVDTALFLMREAAGNLLIEEDAINRERDVVLGEERSRATPAMRELEARFGVLFEGQQLSQRLPIGQTDVLKNAKRDVFYDFYADFYRPEQVTLVIVGDIDPNAVEAKVVKLFGDYAPAKPGPIKATDFGAYKTKGAKVGSYYETGVPERIWMHWVRPLNTDYQTLGEARSQVTEAVAITAINERFARLAQQESTPFASAGFSIQSMPYTGDMVYLVVTPKTGKSKEAFEAAYQIVRQFEVHGITPPELSRALTNFESGLKAAVQGENTRNNNGLADSISASLNDGSVFSSPTQDLALFDHLKPSLTVEAINTAIPGLFSGDGPVLWHSGEGNGGFDDAALMASYETLRSAEVTALDVRENLEWPYTEFGPAAALTDRKEIADLGLVVLTYANGVKLTIKTTDFKADEVNVVVTFVGGLKAMSVEGRPPVFEASNLGVAEGGLGKIDAADMRDSLTGRIYGIGFGIDEDAMALSGTSTRNDFPLQMQILMAFTTDSAFRPDAFARLKAFLPNYYNQIPMTPAGVFGFMSSRILTSDDPRFTTPTQAQFEATTNDQVRALIQSQFQSAPVEVTIVGDISEADARKAFEATFAALPARPSPSEPETASPRFPVGHEDVYIPHNGREDQGLYFVAWPTEDFYADTKRSRGLQLLSSVINLRLIDEVREKQALAYSPRSNLNQSMVFEGYGYMGVSAEVRPEAFETLNTILMTIVTDLQNTPISEDEILRARKPILDRDAINVQTNGYWVQLLPGSAHDPRILDAFRSRKTQLMDIDAPYLQQMAKDYLKSDKAIRIIVRPQPAT